MTIPEKYKHIDFKPPKSVADAAAKGLELRKKNKGKGGLSGQQAKSEGVGSGVQRAVNLKNRDELSPSTVRRMKAFFDRHEKSKEIDKGETYATDKGYIAWCIAGNTLITLGDGSQISIQEMFDSDREFSVLTMNEITGEIEEKRVLAVHESLASPEEFSSIRLNRGNVPAGVISPRLTTWLTSDHQVWTDEKWKKVKELIPGHDRVLRISQGLGQESEQVMLGTLLGDGCLTKEGHLIFSHSSKQAEYAAWKGAFFANSRTSKIFSKASGFRTFNDEVSRVRVCLGAEGKKLRDMVYSPKKEISRYYLENIGPLALAVWFMDDGSLHKTNTKEEGYQYRLHTEGFSDFSIQEIVSWFNAQGLSCKAYKRSNCKGKVIYFSREATNKLASNMADYFCESMQYKLPPNFRNGGFTPIVSHGRYFLSQEMFEVVNWKDAKKSCRKAQARQLQKKFDISVEGNHNFFANGILVHNCLWGGDPGRSWANKVVKQMEAADKKNKRASDYIRKFIKNAFDENYEGDYMSPQHMHAICDKAMELKEVLDNNNDPLPDWLESKISAMADDMDEVYNYMMHGDHDIGE